jgi:16S rRNA (guanine527-N7)-methyltransferase
MLDKREFLRKLKVEKPEEVLDSLLYYVELLKKRNEKHNLISRRSSENIWEEHIVPSLAYSPFLNKEKEYLDLGTGAGLPGLVLKTAFPDLKISLLDSNRKKILFCRYAIDELGLTGISVYLLRAEELEKKFDGILFRAVASRGELIRLALPLLGRGGIILSLKGEEEITPEKNTEKLEIPDFIREASFRLEKAAVMKIQL